MFGFNSEQVYRDEIGELNSRATEIDFDLGDRFRQAYGALIGKDYSRQGLLDGAAKIRNKELSETYDPIASRNKLGKLDPEYKGPEGKTIGELDAAIASDKERASALQRGKATGYLDTSKLGGDADAGTIIGLTNKGQRDSERKEEERIYNRRTDREDTLLERSDIREDRRDARQDKRLAQDRQLTAQTNQMQLQLEYARLAQADKNRREDRKEKALLTLLSGLGNLGQAFAI